MSSNIASFRLFLGLPSNSHHVTSFTILVASMRSRCSNHYNPTVLLLSLALLQVLWLLFPSLYAFPFLPLFSLFFRIFLSSVLILLFLCHCWRYKKNKKYYFLLARKEILNIFTKWRLNLWKNILKTRFSSLYSKIPQIVRIFLSAELETYGLRIVARQSLFRFALLPTGIISRFIQCSEVRTIPA